MAREGRNIVTKDAFLSRLFRVFVEASLTRTKLVNYAPKGPNISSLVVGLPFNKLWRTVRQSTVLIMDVTVSLRESLTYSKVCELYVVVLAR